MRLLVVVLLALAATGCSRKIEVQSDTCWTGYISGGSVEGCGNQTFDINGETVCWTFQKQTVEGYLRVKNKKMATGDEPGTTAAYGVVSGCTE